MRLTKKLKFDFLSINKIEFDAKQLAAAVILKGSFLSPEESKRIKEVYYIIVKRLHPDINPDSDERMNELFVKAQTAYELSDLPTLQQILVLLDNKESDLEVLLPDLQINVNRLAENISTLEHQIEQLYQSFPFIYEEKLRDEEWVKNECEEMSIKIDTIKQEIEKYKNTSHCWKNGNRYRKTYTRIARTYRHRRCESHCAIYTRDIFTEYRCRGNNILRTNE